MENQESQEMLQIEMAAKGCVSGTLAEWPHLERALRKRGIDMANTATAQEMQAACKSYLQRLNKHYLL